MLRGVDPRTETNVSRFATNLVAGTFDLSDHGLLVGVDLANHNRLGLHVGDHVAIASPPVASSTTSTTPKAPTVVAP